VQAFPCVASLRIREGGGTIVRFGRQRKKATCDFNASPLARRRESVSKSAGGGADDLLARPTRIGPHADAIGIVDPGISNELLSRIAVQQSA
jgi:hypothetical protein